MKRKITLFILILLSAVCLAVGLSACNKSAQKSYDYLVTFNYNTENLQLDSAYGNQYLGVKAGSLIMQPCKPESPKYNTSDFKEQQINRYEIQGWYLAKYGEDGNVLKDGSGNVVLDRQWNFSRDTVTNDVTLYAKLVLKPKISLVVDGTVVREPSFVTGKRVTRTGFNPVDPKKDGYTFYDYYKDENFTEKFTFPFIMGTEDVVVYARFIDGENWKFVTTAQQFVNAYHATAKIFVDAAELDFTGVEWKSKIEFNGEINGNGCKLKNIDCPLTGTVSGAQTNMGLFGVLRSGARISNVTFENVTVTVSTVTAVPVQAALFAWAIQSGAVLENVTVSGTISKGSIYSGGDASLYGMCYKGDLTAATKGNCDFSGITINNH